MSVERVRALADRRKLQGLERASLLTWAERAESRPRWDEMTLRDLLAAHGLRLIETELRLGPGLARFGRAVPVGRLGREFATEVRPLPDPAAQQQALDLLAAGEVVALPTDTVYGLAARLDNPLGIAQLYEAKGRDQLKAIAVLVADPGDLAGVAGDLPAGAARLAAHFWPGALTLVTSRSRNLPANLSAQPTVGVRVPDHAAAREFLRRTGPLAVTSANLAGAANSVTAAEVLAQLGGRIPLILDGGETPGGQPSTVVDCTGTAPQVLRAGPIELAALTAVWDGEAD
jgi:L-threonylcarbamoyladenylate synthase